ncbi:E3 ubiquitin-protein ligase ZNF598 [Octopus vulgaris]|uniref:RING-type E3 ubiquitin transferase n=1 Tax=Octopus vulgaris TaxID=6645 RepID=A0AA36APR9_OCTVU|nr:E3 ubiquitin-protein ligase ZNF598 [Octopus vulgaris]
MEGEENICVVCSDEITIFAVGVCDHPICYKCSTRLRVLCMENYCPTCRSNLPEVAFIQKLAKFEDIPNKNKMLVNSQFNLLFENSEIEKRFNQLIEHRCPSCLPNKQTEYKFSMLRSHLRNVHKLYYCDLCVQHLKIFTSERKLYTQAELAHHRSVGDPDDSSYRGHPLCQFCQKRYMDIDDLYRHLRKDHLFCHFCDADNISNQYYDEYSVLKEHFRKEHYLCEEPECANAQFTHAFRTDIDLKKHITQEHGQNLTKAQARQARTIDLDFQLPPRIRARDIGGRPDYRNEASSRGRYSKAQKGRAYFDGRDADLQKAIAASIEDEVQHQQALMKSEGEKTVRKEKSENNSTKPLPKLSLNEDFPSLPSATGVNNDQSTFQTRWATRSNPHNLANNMVEEFPSLTLNSSSTVNAEVKPSLKTYISKKKETNSHKQKQPVLFEEDFPQLATSNKKNNSANHASGTQPNVWTKNTKQQPKKQKQTTFNYRVPMNIDSTDISQLSHTMPVSVNTKQQTNVKQPSAKDQSSNKQASSAKQFAGVKQQTNNSKQQASNKQASNKQQSNNKQTSAKANDMSPVVTLKDVSKLLDSEENFPSLTNKKKSQENNVPVATWPIKKPTVKNSEEKKSNSFTGSLVLKSKKNKEKNSSTEKVSCDSSTKDVKKPVPAADSSESSAAASDPDSSRGNSKSCVDCVIQLNGKAELDEGRADKIGKNWEESDVKADTKRNTSNKQLDARPKEFTVQNILSEEDFPALCKNDKLAQGSSSKTSVKPPPGFAGFPNNKDSSSAYKSLLPRPPPGLSLSNSAITNFQQALTGQHPINATLKFNYCPPSNFVGRNRQLITEIRTALSNDENRFDTFKSLSQDFRHGVISSQEYYRQCFDLLGSENFPNIVQELIALLPDIAKQQALFGVHQDNSATHINTASKHVWTSKENLLQSCHVCQQVLSQSDYKAHISLYHQNSDFTWDSREPSSWSCGNFQNTSLVKAK